MKYELDFTKKPLYNLTIVIYDMIRNWGGELNLTMEKHIDHVVLDAVAINKIDHFLKPKRRADVFSVLSRGVQLSQKDLAKTIGSTATALSNILVVFQNFEYQLLEFSSVGKYRFYRLSTIGEVYLKAKVNSSSAVDGELDGGEEKVISEAKVAIEEFIGLSPYSWENIMFHLLEKRKYGREMGDYKQKLGLEAEDYEKAERVLDQYLACVKLAELENNDVALHQVLNLIENKVLRGLISDIVDIFSQFSALIQALNDGKKLIENYLMVKNVFGTRNEEEVAKYSKSLGWDKEKFDSLRETANELKKNVALMDEAEMCRYFLSILPGQGSLCVYIARCICGDR